MGKLLTYEEAKGRSLLDRLQWDIGYLAISVRAANQLTNMDLTTVAHVVLAPKKQFIKKGFGPVTRNCVKQTIEGMGLEHEMVFTDLLKNKLGIPLTGNEPHEEETVEGVPEQKPALPSKDELVNQCQRLEQELRLLGQEIDSLNATVNIVPASASILSDEIKTREEQIAQKEIAFKHYDTLVFVLQ